MPSPFEDSIIETPAKQKGIFQHNPSILGNLLQDLLRFDLQA